MKKGNSRRRRFIVDLIGIRSAARLHAALAEKLPLPEHYGRNLDAFHDVLTEFGARWSIVFRNAGAVTKGLPRSRQEVGGCMRRGEVGREA